MGACKQSASELTSLHFGSRSNQQHDYRSEENTRHYSRSQDRFVYAPMILMLFNPNTKGYVFGRSWKSSSRRCSSNGRGFGPREKNGNTNRPLFLSTLSFSLNSTALSSCSDGARTLFRSSSFFASWSPLEIFEISADVDVQVATVIVSGARSRNSGLFKVALETAKRLVENTQKGRVFLRWSQFQTQYYCQ